MLDAGSPPAAYRPFVHIPFANQRLRRVLCVQHPAAEGHAPPRRQDLPVEARRRQDCEKEEGAMAGKGVEVAPLKRVRLFDEVTEHLRELILSGEIPPGTQLFQIELAQQLG